MRETGRRVLVTGAGRGVGRAIAVRFLAAGDTVVALDRDAASLAGLADEHAGVTTVCADLRSRADVARACAEAGAVDVLCNNAGVIDRMGLVDEVTDEEWDRVLGVNLTGAFLMCRACVPGMVARGGGAIVNVASVAGLSGGRAGAAYTASKWGLLGLTQSVAYTFRNRGIRCNAVCPGAIDTGIHDDVEMSPRFVEALGGFGELPLPAAPAQIAAAAWFLASDEASYVNGATLRVDAGWTAR